MTVVMMEKSQISFRVLSSADAAALTALLQSQSLDYLKGFHPYPFEEEEIRCRLKAIQQDVWWGIEAEGKLAGLVMLRGLDEGYKRPAFGVFVAEEYAGHGLARQALRHCLAWCQSRGILRVMLKVEPTNIRAKNLYLDEGFKADGICSRSGQEIMEWSEESSR